MTLLATLAATPGRATFPGENGKIAFQAGGEIHVINPDGSGQTLLTPEPEGDGTNSSPSWSPTGTKILFESNRDGGPRPDIWLMNAEGSGQIKLRDSAESPSWSPDGTKILFNQFCGTRCLEIWVMDADGTDPVLLVPDATPSHPTNGGAVWSPDGTRIAFQRSLSDTNIEVMLANADGSSVSACTSFGQNSRAPSWSPDGAKLVFDKGPPGTAGISVISVAGLTCFGHTALITSGIQGDPVWSPDGSKIAFGRHPSGLWTMNADGSGQVALGAGDSVNVNPDWQPIVNSPPDCSSVVAMPSTLWPPNHRLRLILITGATDPDGDLVTLTITGVTQDEPVNGLGDGDASPDAEAGPQPDTVRLRAERSGNGDGRVYRIAFTGSDGQGGVCSGTSTVGVPHDQGAGSTPVDSAPPVFDSFGT